MKNHFIFGYFGNKRKEGKMIYDCIKDDIKDKKYIVEPFCGTSAISYYISNLHPKKYTYIINDNNKYLIELYNILKDDKKIEEFEETIYKILTPFPTKDEYNDIIKNDVYGYYIKNKFYDVRVGLYPINKINYFEKIIKDKKLNIINCNIINFLKNEKVKIYSEDWTFFNSKINNEKYYFIFDPPYLLLSNNYYDYVDSGTNIYKWFSENKESLKLNNIIIIVNKTWIIEYLFKNYKIVEYDKTYDTNGKKNKNGIRLKNKAVHLLIKNIIK